MNSADAASSPPERRVAGIKPKAISAALLRHPSAHVLTPLAHALRRRTCMRRSACNCARFPLIVSIIQSSPCHSFTSLFCSVSRSLPPHVLVSRLPLPPTRSQSQKHAHVPIYPPTRAVGTAESLTSSTVWRGVMQRNTNISAVPLPNGVSMATKGARPCDAVSNTQRILNLSKEFSFVCWRWDWVNESSELRLSYINNLLLFLSSFDRII